MLPIRSDDVNWTPNGWEGGNSSISVLNFNNNATWVRANVPGGL